MLPAICPGLSRPARGTERDGRVPPLVARPAAPVPSQAGSGDLRLGKRPGGPGVAILTLVLELPPAAARAAGGPRVFPQNAPCCIWQMRTNVWGASPPLL